MKFLRNPGFLAAAAVTMLLTLYIGFVADRAVVLLRLGGPAGYGIGTALLILPAVGVWWVIREWSAGLWIQRMTDALELRGQMPEVAGARTPSGRLTDDAAQAVFAHARAAVDARPNDWASWYHVAFAYDRANDRRMARRSYAHAADLFRADRDALKRR